MTLGGRAPLLPVANRTPTPTITNAEMWKSVSSRVGVPFGPVTGEGGVGAARAAVRAERAYDDDAEVVVDDVPIVTPASVRALRGTKGAVGRNIGFLTASGGRLALGGTAWSGAGANAYYLASLTAFGVSEAELVAQLGVHADAGATLLRVWFANDFAPRGTQPTLGVFNEAALARVDFVMAAAAAYGIRVIGVLSNYWPFAGGWQAWVDAAGPVGGRPIETFLTDASLRATFKTWVTTMVNRTNTITGVTYANDPTLAVWELANEPHTTDNLEKDVLHIPPGTIMCTWVADMAAHIKDLDANHLVATGEEGYAADAPTPTHTWIGDGTKGNDFTCHLARTRVDVATLHTYPDSWGMPDYEWLGPNFLAARAAVAARYGKPVLLEEYGTGVAGASVARNRDTLFTYLTTTADWAGADASLVWAVAPRTAGGVTPGNDAPCSTCPPAFVFT